MNFSLYTLNHFETKNQSIIQFNARFNAQRHYQGRLPNLDRSEMAPPSHSNLENKEGKSKNRPGQNPIKTIRDLNRLRRITGVKMSFYRSTKRKKSRRKTHIKRKRVPKSGSRARKRKRPRTRFHKRFSEKRVIRGSKRTRRIVRF